MYHLFLPKTNIPRRDDQIGNGAIWGQKVKSPLQVGPSNGGWDFESGR